MSDDKLLSWQRGTEWPLSLLALGADGLDLVVIVLPLLRPLRMMRLLTLLDALNRRAANSLRGRVAIYVVSATSLILYCAALAVLDAERGKPDTNITFFPDALWWATTTVTTRLRRPLPHHQHRPHHRRAAHARRDRPAGIVTASLWPPGCSTASAKSNTRPGPPPARTSSC